MIPARERLQQLWRRTSERVLSNVLHAFEAIIRNKLRAMLTSLGIMFGVGSVIAMLAVGRGAQQEILDQMKLLGANNIIITPVIEQEEGKVRDETTEKASEKKRFSPGLTLQDAQNILVEVPHIRYVSPEVVVETMALREGFKRSTKLVGVDTTFFLTSEFEVEEGRLFSHVQNLHASPVAVIGHAIRTKFFARENPIGRSIKCGKLWLTVVGVMKERSLSQSNLKHLGLRDYNFDIYTPVNTMLLRYKNRNLVTRQDIQKASRNQGQSDDNEPKKSINYHQLDRLVVRVGESEYMLPVAEIISRLLQRRHNTVVDYQVTVPEELLKQEQRTKDVFNIVLGAIASISLIVGGIGIMNIMLASVLERTKEIGIRRAVGATRRDITTQFLSEAVTISITGGVVGIGLGLLMSLLIQQMTGIMTIVSMFSIVISFFISISVGIIFGIFPARRAAFQDPIASLRYE